MIYIRHLALFVFCVAPLGMIGCGNVGTLFPVSDVPCFQPTAWSSGVAGWRLIRPIPDVEGAILITQQSSEQIDADGDDGDGMATFFPRDPVYRFSPDTGIIELVDSSVWDNLTTPVEICTNSGSGGDVSPFKEMGTRLFFNEQEIPLAGGSFVGMEGASFSAVVAAISTDGSVLRGVPFVPVTLVKPSGQHFHQLFSRVDGSPIGEAVRLSLVGRADQCWAARDKYVIYRGGVANKGLTICIVPIEDELPRLNN